jgi:hypothetical protein
MRATSGLALLLRRASLLLAIRCAGVLALSGTQLAWPGERGGDNDPPGEDSAIHVRAVMVIVTPISKPALATAQREAQRIWGRYGVRIHWLSPGPPVGSAVSVVVLMAPDSKRCALSRIDREHTLGCFQDDREGDSRPVITIFPQRAYRLVSGRAERLWRRRPEGWLEGLTATLLGRVLAHEFGHYLLGSEHSATGLMHAALDPRELFTRQPDELLLTEGQARQLTSRSEARRPMPMEAFRGAREPY